MLVAEYDNRAVPTPEMTRSRRRADVLRLHDGTLTGNLSVTGDDSLAIREMGSPKNCDDRRMGKSYGRGYKRR